MEVRRPRLPRRTGRSPGGIRAPAGGPGPSGSSGPDTTAGRGRRGWRARAFLRRLLALLVVVVALALGRDAAYAVFPFPYAPAVRAAARGSGIDPLLVLAVMRTESGFRPRARSRAGAMGLMQLTPPTASWMATQVHLPQPTPARLADPPYNIVLGASYLAHLRAGFGGRIVPALAAYNAGPGPVTTWLAAGTWDGRLATADRIPFPETRRFVQRVLGTYRVYRLLYG